MDRDEKKGRRLQKKRETKHLIVEAAARLFIEKGVEQTTIAAIIERTGLARGTFYNYFQKKEELWRYLVMKILQKSNEMMQAAAATASTRETYVYQTFLAYLNVVMTDEVNTALIIRNQAALRTALFSGDDAHTVTATIESNFRQSGFFTGIDDVQLRLLVYALIGSGLEVVVQTYLQGGTATPEKLALFLSGLFTKGLDGITAHSL